MSRELPPQEGEHLLPVDRDHEGVPLASESDPSIRPSPSAEPPVPPGLLPAAHVEPLNMEDVAEERGPAASVGVSRRSSVQEPAQEPETRQAEHNQAASSSSAGPAPGTPIQRLLQAVQRGREVNASRQISEEEVDDELTSWFSLDSEGQPV